MAACRGIVVVAGYLFSVRDFQKSPEGGVAVVLHFLVHGIKDVA